MGLVRAYAERPLVKAYAGRPYLIKLRLLVNMYLDMAVRINQGVSRLRYLKNPFVPERKVSLILIDGRAPEDILNKLESLGIECIKTNACSSVYSSISYHPDIQMHPLGGNRIIVSPEMHESLSKKLQKFNFNIICGSTHLKSNYPEDIAYNVARIGPYCLHNLKYTDPVLKKHLEEKGLTFINIKQGYSKCSISVISNSAIITSDAGIHKAASENRIDSLLISPDSIQLAGQSHGFIGGCTGLITPDILAVTGSLEKHPDYSNIKMFLAKHGVKMVNLSDSSPIDLGSLIPLLEIE